jgi:Bardet-Biedl syndrome 5 protein
MPQESTLPGNDAYVWQDRELRFDTAPTFLDERRGEQRIDSINSVEDTKGNNGERGALIVTNLRIIWQSHKAAHTNLSVGFNTILRMSKKKAQSKMRGKTEALVIMTKYEKTRFEFIFTSLVKNSPRLFTTCLSVFKAYETTKMYRDLKLRCSIVREGELELLPLENVYSKLNGVWNLSSEQGNLGSFIITNVRIVWHANLAHNFNVSIPYMQIKSIRLRTSKFGKALVIETSAKMGGGGYILGFRVDPPEKLNEVLQECQSLHHVHSNEPVFGVQWAVEDVPDQVVQPMARVIDDVSIVDHEDGLMTMQSYFADPNKVRDREVQFDADLGLAIEAPPEGATTGDLWRVVNE